MINRQLKRVVTLVTLALYTGAVVGLCISTPEPPGILPQIEWKWIILSHEMQKSVFLFAMVPVWCLGIHRIIHKKQAGLKQFGRVYGVVTALGLMTAGYLFVQLQAEDCLKSCPDGAGLLLISVWFCTLLISAMGTSTLARLKELLASAEC